MIQITLSWYQRSLGRCAGQRPQHHDHEHRLLLAGVSSAYSGFLLSDTFPSPSLYSLVTFPSARADRRNALLLTADGIAVKRWLLFCVLKGVRIAAVGWTSMLQAMSNKPCYVRCNLTPAAQPLSNTPTVSSSSDDAHCSEEVKARLFNRGKSQQVLVHQLLPPLAHACPAAISDA